MSEAKTWQRQGAAEEEESGARRERKRGERQRRGKRGEQSRGRAGEETAERASNGMIAKGDKGGSGPIRAMGGNVCVRSHAHVRCVDPAVVLFGSALGRMASEREPRGGIRGGATTLTKRTNGQEGCTRAPRH